MIPSTVRQDVVALLTVAMDVSAPDELRALVDEFGSKANSDELIMALVSLCRSLCLVSSKLVHVVDDQLTVAQAERLTDDDLLPVAMQIVRQYAHAAARDSDHAPR